MTTDHRAPEADDGAPDATRAPPWTADAARAAPLLLLDVDGVLNALGKQPQDFAAWPEWRDGFARAAHSLWPITFAPGVVRRLNDWREQDAFELQWLTTWGHEANGSLRQLLQLPELPVAGTQDDEDGDGQERAGDADVEALADSKGSAPDLVTGSWWKHDVVRRLRSEQPGRRIVWVDDELTPDSPFTEWAALQPGLEAVGPDPACGLSPSDLTRIERCFRPEWAT